MVKVFMVMVGKGGEHQGPPPHGLIGSGPRESLGAAPKLADGSLRSGSALVPPHGEKTSHEVRAAQAAQVLGSERFAGLGLVGLCELGFACLGVEPDLRRQVLELGHAVVYIVPAGVFAALLEPLAERANVRSARESRREAEEK